MDSITEAYEKADQFLALLQLACAENLSPTDFKMVMVCMKSLRIGFDQIRAFTAHRDPQTNV